MDEHSSKHNADQRRRKRSIAIGLTLTAFAILFYAITVAKLGMGVLNRPM